MRGGGGAHLDIGTGRGGGEERERVGLVRYMLPRVGVAGNVGLEGIHWQKGQVELWGM